jgi:RNA polymerase sigma-70 factor (ECF subfamily)
MVMSDAELVARVRDGDIEAFGRLSERYERTLLAVALTELRDIHAAEDVAQATLLLAFRRLETLRDAAKFAPWLMQIARRQAIEALRARRIPVSIPPDDCGDDAVCDPAIETWMDNEHLLSLVVRLPDHERVLIGHRYFDGHGMAQIAQITGRPIGTVTKQLSRAIARLRSWWEKEDQR